MIVLGGYGQVDPNNWKSSGSTVISRSVHWLSFIQTAAWMLELHIAHGRDYLLYSDRDIRKLQELGFNVEDLGATRFTPSRGR